jgi:hypothetical protein
MRLFASDVLPVIKQIPGEQAEAIPFAEWRRSASAALA